MTGNPLLCPYISEENQLQCSLHSLAINNILLDANGLRFLCSECLKPRFALIRDPIINVDKQHQFYTLSLSDLSAPIFNRNPENVKNEVMEFRLMEVEHIIIDRKSQGYSPRNLVYVADKNLLVACSSNGHVAIWSIGEVVQWRSEFNIEKPIKFAKYMNRRDCGSNYLILGVGAGTEAHAYEVVEDRLSFVSMINCDLEAFDAEWIPESDQLVIAGNGNIIQIWDVKTFSLERTIDVEASGTHGPIYRLIYLSHKNALALENMTGVSLISLNKEDVGTEKLPKHFHIPDRKILGLAYLPISRCFMLRGNSQIEVIDEDYFFVRAKKYTSPTTTSSSRLLDSQILINEDESQFMTSNPPKRLYIYFQDGTFHILTPLQLVAENFVLEMIIDQHRVIMGDQDSGTIYILRTNAELPSMRKIPGYQYPENDLYPFYKNMHLQLMPKKETRKAPKKKTQTETSKDQLKQRAAKNNQEKPKKKNAKAQQGSNDGTIEIEIEKAKIDQDEFVSTRQTQSQTRKEQDKTKKRETKPKTKGVRGKIKEEKQAEKTRERSKARKGKKK